MLGEGHRKSQSPETLLVRGGEVVKFSVPQQTEEARLKRRHGYPRRCPPPAPYSALRATRSGASPSLARASGPWRPAILLEGVTTRRGVGTRERQPGLQFQRNTSSAAAHTPNAELPGKPPALIPLPVAERKLRRSEA